MVRAHRQAWCWQDEWYGLTMEDIRQLELETQLALATKMAQFSQAEEATEANGSAPSPDKEQEAKEAISSIEAEEVVVVSSSGGETLQPRGVLTKQWSTSSRSSRSSKRGGKQHQRHLVSGFKTGMAFIGLNVVAPQELIPKIYLVYSTRADWPIRRYCKLTLGIENFCKSSKLLFCYAGYED